MNNSVKKILTASRYNRVQQWRPCPQLPSTSRKLFLYLCSFCGFCMAILTFSPLPIQSKEVWELLWAELARKSKAKCETSAHYHQGWSQGTESLTKLQWCIFHQHLGLSGPALTQAQNPPTIPLPVWGASPKMVYTVSTNLLMWVSQVQHGWAPLRVGSDKATTETH